MQQPFLRASLCSLHHWMFPKRAICQSIQRFATNPATAVGRSDRVKLANENVLNATLTQSHEMSAESETLPQLLDPLEAKARGIEFPTAAKLSSAATLGDVDAAVTDAGPLPFEEVPGPAVLKLWEKYWRYVPLFGRLKWNRNITPMRYLFNEYGPVVRLNGPLTGDIVLIHRPEHIAKVFEEEGDLPTRSGIDVLQHYRLNYRKYRFVGPFCADGAQGAEWIQLKKSLESPIVEQIDKQFGKLEMICEELIHRIRQIKNRQDEVPGNFNQELSRWGMECFWLLMMNRKMGFLDSSGYNESSEATRFIEALHEAHLYMSRCETGFQVWRFLETPFCRKLFNACDVIDGVTGKYIRSAQSNIRTEPSALRDENRQNRSNVLECLLGKQRMNPEDVSTLMMDMIILGVQATTNCQAFLLYFLAKNPRVQRNVFDEIISKIREDPVITKKTLENMPYLSACVKECLRLRPSFPYLTRLLPKNITLHGYKIPKGTYLIMAHQITVQREENFEDAGKFKPERWLNVKDDPYPINYLPFGKGLRSCLGEQMAKLEMMLLTTKIIREFKVEYDYADINSNFLMVNVPNRPLRFRFVDRD